MGSGISSLSRLRKAVLIRAYNLRAAEQTLIDQFMPFTYQKEGKGLYISIHQIKKCLKMDAPEYQWIEEVLQAIFITPTTPPTQKPSEMFFYDFIQFLETGKAPNTVFQEPHQPPDGRIKSFNSDSDSPRNRSIPAEGRKAGKDSPARTKQFPPMPPSSREPEQDQDNHNNDLDHLKQTQQSLAKENIIEINLSKVNLSSNLPESVKLHDSNAQKSSKLPSSSNKPPEETLEVIIRPAGGGKMPLGLNTQGKALWRKREVVKQERSVHYTTIDDEGGLQELVEKETTQTEVLHMECRETGEFAHRELTEFESVETFNNEIVNAVRGNEEYVHLKSLEDEFHYMESNMPPKEGSKEGDERERDRPHPGDPSDPSENPPHPEEAEEKARDRPDPPLDPHHKESGYNEYDQFINTEHPTDNERRRKHDEEELLNPPEVKTPLQALSPNLTSPINNLSRHRRSRDQFDENKEENDDLGTVVGNENMEDEDEEIVLQEPGSFSRTDPFQNTTTNFEEDPLNSTMRKSFMSTHSSYQSLHEID